jgi:hypothetical protein
MAIDFRESPDKISGKGGAFRHVAGGALTIQAACREVWLQSCASNVSAVRVSIAPTTAAAGIGLVIPMAATSVIGSDYIAIPVSTLTVLSTYSNESTQSVDVLWRA